MKILNLKDLVLSLIKKTLLDDSGPQHVMDIETSEILIHDYLIKHFSAAHIKALSAHEERAIELLWFKISGELL